jgi:hypothetical protein
VRTFLARSVASRGRRSTAGRRASAGPKVGGPKRPTDAESRTLRPLTPNSGPNFWDWRYTGSVVESALRSRRLTSKELGHVIMCAYGAPRAGIFNGRVLRDVPSRGQCLTCCVPAGRSAIGTADARDDTTSNADDRAQERLDPRGWGTAGRAPGEGPAHAGVAAAGAPLAARDPDCTNTMRILTGTLALGFNESINNKHKVDR